MPQFFQIIEFIGTFAFAISGVRLASAKRFDWFGAYVVGVATAIGGGTIRDVMIGVPPFWMNNSITLICSGFALLWVVVFGKQLIKQKNTWFLFDTIGLALFTVTGVEKTLAFGFPAYTAIIMGAITGAAGGVIRDVLINEVPLIFRKEIYALACIIGGTAYIMFDHFGIDKEFNAVLSGLIVIFVRLISVKYHLSLPVLKSADENIK
jgi:uncharacterized membrane protein YeiH